MDRPSALLTRSRRTSQQGCFEEPAEPDGGREEQPKGQTGMRPQWPATRIVARGVDGKGRNRRDFDRDGHDRPTEPCTGDPRELDVSKAETLAPAQAGIEQV